MPQKFDELDDDTGDSESDGSESDDDTSDDRQRQAGKMQPGTEVGTTGRASHVLCATPKKRCTVQPQEAMACGSAVPSATPEKLQPTVTMAPEKPKRCHGEMERVNYTDEDDAAVWQWILAHPGCKKQWQAIWVQAAQAKITDHSWQSMQNRWRRHLAIICDDAADYSHSKKRPRS